MKRCAAEPFSTNCGVHIEGCKGWWLSVCRTTQWPMRHNSGHKHVNVTKTVENENETWGEEVLCNGLMKTIGCCYVVVCQCA